ncbi:MAG: hypothetical protein ABIF12_03220 [bacterium]
MKKIGIFFVLSFNLFINILCEQEKTSEIVVLNDNVKKEELVDSQTIDLVKALGPTLLIQDTTGIATGIVCNYLDKYNQKFNQTLIFSEEKNVTVQYYYWLRELVSLTLKNTTDKVETAVFEITFDSKNNNIIFENKLLNSYLDLVFVWGPGEEKLERIEAQKIISVCLLSDSGKRLNKITIY